MRRASGASSASGTCSTATSPRTSTPGSTTTTCTGAEAGGDGVHAAARHEPGEPRAASSRTTRTGRSSSLVRDPRAWYASARAPRDRSATGLESSPTGAARSRRRSRRGTATASGSSSLDLRAARARDGGDDAPARGRGRDLDVAARCSCRRSTGGRSGRTRAKRCRQHGVLGPHGGLPSLDAETLEEVDSGWRGLRAGLPGPGLVLQPACAQRCLAATGRRTRRSWRTSSIPLSVRHSSTYSRSSAVACDLAFESFRTWAGPVQPATTCRR